MSALSDVVQKLKPEGAYELLAKAQALERQGHSVINFGIGQPDFASPPTAVDAAKKALDEGKTTYCNPSGTAELKSALAEHMLLTRNVNTHPEQIVITPGCKPAMWFTCTAILQPGDEVLVPDPGFPTYAEMVNCLGAKPVYYNSLQPLEREVLAAMLTPRTRLVIINSPSNPTGRVASADELDGIATVCAAHPRVWVMSDEIYGSLFYADEKHEDDAAPKNAPSMLACSQIRKRLIMVDGFSKTWSMTGWRLGFAVCPPSLAEKLHIIVMHALGCTALFSQIAAVESIRRGSVAQMLKVYRERRDYMVQRLNAMPGVTCDTPGGAFYVFPRCVVRAVGSDGQIGPEMTMHELSSKLLLAGVACLQGDAFGPVHGSGYLRLSYVSDMQQLVMGLDRMEAYLKSQALEVQPVSAGLITAAPSTAAPASKHVEQKPARVRARVLVLGARGFIGSHVVAHLEGRHTVVPTTSDQLNLLDRDAVAAFFAEHDRFDLVVHSCAIGGSRLAPDGPQVMADNLKMLDTVLEQRERYDRLVYFSSGAARTAKDTPYGFAKHLADIMLRQEPKAFSFRVYGCFGPGEPEQRMITSCLRKRKRGEELEVHADRYFDFIFIGDLCKLVELTLRDDCALPREMDAVYEQKLKLTEIVRPLSDNVKIVQKQMGADYIGDSSGSVEAALGGAMLGLRHGMTLLEAHVEGTVQRTHTPEL